MEDGSKDGTLKICKGFANRFAGEIKVVCRSFSDGKPSALVEALKHASGDIVGVFDENGMIDFVSKAAIILA